MVYNLNGQSIKIEDRMVTIGNFVKANNTSVYNGMTGSISAIKTNDDKETDNDGIDIYVNFYPSEEEKCNFKKIAGNEESGFDDVVMDISMIDDLDTIRGFDLGTGMNYSCLAENEGE